MRAEIRGFRGNYAWASSFYQAPVEYRGILWPDNEHPFQWSKTLDPGYRALIKWASTAEEAKKRGREAPLRTDWERIKKRVMFDLVMAKFTQNPRLGKILVATGDVDLIEENHWRDTYWGVCNGVGHNYLGRILMSVRYLLQED